MNIQPIVNFLRSPEWVAAVALLIQGVILLLQWRTLGRHAKTMEEHTEIARKQAETAELIGKALKQQGEIMAEQFRFEGKMEASAERQAFFTLALDVRAKLRRLNSTVSKLQLSTYTKEDDVRVRQDFDALQDTIWPCMEALVTSIHLAEDEKKYFWAFIKDADDLKLSNDIRNDTASVMALEKKYENFGPTLMKVAKPRETEFQKAAGR